MTSVGNPLFQFHKGTIRTKATQGRTTLQADFNSIKVRLEPAIIVSFLMIKRKFQFHKGTIRTIFDTQQAQVLV